MFPLILVGITLVSCTLGDVKHVLDGTVGGQHSSSVDPKEINRLAYSGSAKSPRDFWWMADDSPLKEAYDYYKKCSLKGNCANVGKSVAGSEIGKNPFLNGDFKNGKIPTGGAVKSAGFHSGATLDLSNNPFLNGKYATNAKGEKIPIGNGFIGVQPQFATNHPLTNKKPFSTTHPLLQNAQNVSGNKQSAAGAPEGTTLCKGHGYICVENGLCKNGFVNHNGEGLLQIRSDVQFCQNNQVCCRLSSAGPAPQKINLNLPALDNNLNQVTAGKSSVPESAIKFGGLPGFSSGTIQILNDQNLEPQISVAGESGHHKGSSTIKPRDVSDSLFSASSSTPDYSNVDFGDVRFASTIQGPAYLPPDRPDNTNKITTYVPPPRPTCAPGQIQLPSGVCGYPSTPRPTCAPGQITLPSGGCGYPSTTRPTCAPGQIQLPYGGCGYPSTPRPTCAPGQITLPSGGCGYPSTPRPTCAPGQITLPGGGCGYPTTPRPTCAPGQIQTPSGGCVYPTTPRPTCAPGQITLPGGGCGYPTTPRPTCAPGQITLPGGGCGYPTTPRPTCAPGQITLPGGGCGYPTTPRPTCAPGQIQLPYGGCGYPSTPRPTCAPGQITLPGGGCGYPSSPRPTCAPGQITLPGGGCAYPTTPRPTCAPGQIQLPSGVCAYPTTPRPRPTCGPGQVLSPSGSCVYISTTPRPCGFGQIRNPQGVCEYVGSPSTTPAEYLPPRPPSTTQRPGYSYPTPTPSFTYPSPIIPDGNNVDNVYVPSPTTSTTTPRTGESIKDTNTPDHETSPGGNDEIRIPIPGQPRPVGPSGPSGPPPPSCAAALKCVQEIYCTADGFVSPVPVVLTKEQELLRVPTTECSNQESGTIGKCCRDPNYKDPWPSANLVDGFDDGQYKEDNHFGEVGNLQRIVRSQQGSVQRLVRSQKSPVNARSINSSPAVPQQLARSQEQCGTRNYNTKPQGQRPIDMNFAEIPWQAMILRDTNRSLLCGGAIIRSDAVLTAAHCVEGLETSDILIKGGEWKLGIDEEPLPFQIVKVAAIVRHPEYVHGALVNDLAVLVLEEKLRLAKNIGPICLPEPNQIPTQNCIATGWGKRILQLHAKNALMHGIDVKIMDTNQCKETLAEKFKDSVQNYSPNTLCGFSSIDQCRVDYGSALACDNGNGQYTLSGIYSWDTGCKQEGQIGGYIAPDVEWVRGCLNKPINELKRLDSEYTSKSRN
ncbi:unnamed protein product [Brassicogethes aeneus]|uniref:Peptidase S1 domain-containing protein n=1 Tax=Brassicogethes aeneus TaxID=1431903 RepID=A0A9P0AW93_BRAAE|nr:unnamed protein product [Brassicogethes aeneus]CAH0549424.1 unnamed protein product [Brassicogethes aeneus]